MHGLLQRFRRDRSGATAIEYALIASLIAVVIAGSVAALGTHLVATYNSVTAIFPA
jgi:pilus assembly protein Flp/PilA